MYEILYKKKITWAIILFNMFKILKKSYETPLNLAKLMGSGVVKLLFFQDPDKYILRGRW